MTYQLFQFFVRNKLVNFAILAASFHIEINLLAFQKQFSFDKAKYQLHNTILG